MNAYDNAVPKPLKFLISDGKMIDDAGNVIAESETLKDLCTKWNLEVKKYLLSDGSVVDENNNLIVKNDYYKKMYEQVGPKVAKYLHADGTIDENPGTGGGGSSNTLNLYGWRYDGLLYFLPYDKASELISLHTMGAEVDVFGFNFKELRGFIEVDGSYKRTDVTDDDTFDIIVEIKGSVVHNVFTRSSEDDTSFTFQ